MNTLIGYNVSKVETCILYIDCEKITEFLPMLNTYNIFKEKELIYEDLPNSYPLKFIPISISIFNEGQWRGIFVQVRWVMNHDCS
jgi:hypothetical protein